MNDLSSPIVIPTIGHNQPPGPVDGAFKVDISRGTRRGEVSAQWASRPADERFLSLTSMLASVEARMRSSFEEVIPAGAIRFQGNLEDSNVLTTIMPDGREISPTHYSLGQLATLAKIGASAGMLRAQPGFLAAANLNWALNSHIRNTPLKAYGDTSSNLLRAATGPLYGRIYDADVVKMIMKVAGNGVGDTNWKVPGVLDWSQMRHNPFVDISRDTTTLFASDRDMFVFLVDDTHPIEIGKLRDGSPDLVFRGFYVSNSETGHCSLRVATMWLRAVCMNRNLWGTQDFKEVKVIHSAGGPARFVREVGPALLTYAKSDPSGLLAGIKAAKMANVAKDDDDRKSFLTADALGFSMAMADKICEVCELEEGRRPETAWDFIQGITAVARHATNNYTRLDIERKAARIMQISARDAQLV